MTSSAYHFGITHTPPAIRKPEAHNIACHAERMMQTDRADSRNSRFKDEHTASVVATNAALLAGTPIAPRKPHLPKPTPSSHITPHSRPFSPVAAVAAGSHALRSFFSSSSKSSLKGKGELKKPNGTIRGNENTAQGRTLKWGNKKSDARRKDVQHTEHEVQPPPSHHPGTDGTRKPPSLARGVFMSQPQLGMFLEPEEAARRATGEQDGDCDEGTCNRPGLISGQRRRTAAQALDLHQNGPRPFPTEKDGQIEVYAPVDSRRDISEAKTGHQRSIKRSLTMFKNAVRSSNATIGRSKHEVEPAPAAAPTKKSGQPWGKAHRSEGARSSISSTIVPSRGTESRFSLGDVRPPVVLQRASQNGSPSPTILHGQTTLRSSSTIPRRESSPGLATGSRDSSGAQTPLSEADETRHAEEHYMLRIAVTYLVKSVLPHIISKTTGRRKSEPGSAFMAQSTENNSSNIHQEGPLRSVLEERLRSLQRMERAWGSAWIARGPAGGGMRLSERTRAKERRSLKDALRDGVLLC